MLLFSWNFQNQWFIWQRIDEIYDLEIIYDFLRSSSSRQPQADSSLPQKGLGNTNAIAPASVSMLDEMKDRMKRRNR